MSTVAEVKSATEQLSAQDRLELYRWLRDKEESRQLDELRREIATGVEQADRGDLAPLDTKKTMEEVRRRLRSEGK
jgi:hypothetical protein